jgi:hypothetical protein
MKSASGIIKTVILPHEDINRLSNEADMLIETLARQEQLFKETVSGYQKDRVVR